MNTGIKFNSTDIKCCGGSYVFVLIPDQEARLFINWPFHRSLLEHTGARLSAPAPHCQRLDRPLGMVRTVIERVDMSSARGKVSLHMGMEQLYGVLIEIAASNAGLIADNEHIVARLVQQLHGFLRSRNPFELIGSVGVTKIHIEDTVAIKKCSWKAPSGFFHC